MAAYSYDDFRIRIAPGPTPSSYRVEASGFGGEASASVELPFNDDQLKIFILQMSRPRATVRRLDSQQMGLARDFGSSLFTALMGGRVGDAFREAMGAAKQGGRGLRVTLSMTEVPKLATIPWEFLFKDPDFLSTSRRTPIVRTLDVMAPARPFDLTPPIRILGVVSLPSDVTKLETSQEQLNLAKALEPLQKTGGLAIEWIEHATLSALNDKLSESDFHIVHFIGHGGFDEAHGEGALLFEDAKGRHDIVGADRLASIIRDRDSVQLIVLNACEGARSDVADPFSGVAASLIQREVPAVIGMQFEITDRAAIIFATKFYTFLARGDPVDAALAEARRAIYADQNDMEWATPVLFMRVSDGRLFTIRDAVPIADIEPKLPPREQPPLKEPTDVPPPPDVITPPVAASSPSLLERLRHLPTWARRAGGLAVAIPLVLVALLLLLPRGAAAIEVTETPGTPGMVTVTGSGFQAGELVDIIVDRRLVDTIVADASGAIAVDVLVGTVDHGTITASGRSSERTDDAEYTLARASESPGTSGQASASLPGSVPPSIDPTATPSQPASVEPSVEPSMCPIWHGRAEPATLGDVPSGSILFHSDYSPTSAGTDFELYAIDPATGHVYQLTDNDVDDENPSWYTGDYGAIVWAQGPRGSRDIHIMYADGADQVLFEDEADDWFPNWSSNKTVAWVRGTRPASIWTDSNGLVYEGDIVRSPAWSPDGERLAFFGNLTGSDYDIGITPPIDGRDVVTRIEGTFEMNPTWAPDAQTLALVQGLEGQRETNDIYLFDIASETLSGPFPSDRAKRVGQDGNPVWSPDGSKLAFYKQSQGGYHIWLMNRDGTGACDLMPNRPGQNLDPNWR